MTPKHKVVPIPPPLPPRERLRRADDHMTARDVVRNIGLVFGILLCIATAISLKLFSKDSTVVDVMAGIFMLIAVFCALPMQFRGFINTVGPYIPIIGRGSAARAAITASDEAVVASTKAATAVRRAADDSAVKPDDAGPG